MLPEGFKDFALFDNTLDKGYKFASLSDEKWSQLAMYPLRVGTVLEGNMQLNLPEKTILPYLEREIKNYGAFSVVH